MKALRWFGWLPWLVLGCQGRPAVDTPECDAELAGIVTECSALAATCEVGPDCDDKEAECQRRKDEACK